MQWYLGKNIKITKSSLHLLDKEIEKLNNKINNLNKKKSINLEHIKYSIISDSEFSVEETLTERLFYGFYKERKVNITYILIKIEGLNPKINDYKVISKMEIHPELDDFQFFPFIENINKPNINNLKCEHCNNNRKRKFYYQLKKGKEIITVGKSCLKHYNNIDEISKMINKLNTLFIDHVEKEYLFKRHIFTKMDLDNYISTVSTVFLFLKKHNSGVIKKENYINNIILLNQKVNDLSNEDKETFKLYQDFFNKHKQEIYEFKNNIFNFFSEYNDNNNFIKNIKLELSLQESKPLKNVKWGLLRYAPLIMEDVKYKKRDKKNNIKYNDSFYGNIGETTELSLIYDKSLEFDGYYQNQSSFMHFFYTKEGNIIVWSTSKSTLITFGQFLEKGDEVKVKAKIKKHEIYNEKKQTFVTRCRNIRLVCFNHFIN